LRKACGGETREGSDTCEGEPEAHGGKDHTSAGA
jgi:hypothetical protein